MTELRRSHTTDFRSVQKRIDDLETLDLVQIILSVLIVVMLAVKV